MTPERLDEIRGRTDLGELLEEAGVPMRRSGSGLTGRCPFHADRRPSLAAWPEIGRWRCYGCGAAGDCFEFMTRLLGISFREALETLAARAGVAAIEGKRRRRPPRIRRSLVIRPGDADPDFTARSERRAATTTDAELLEHAEALGVSLRSLRRLGAFTSPRWPEATCYPMRRATGQVVGIRVRHRDGRKWSVTGSRNSLFRPTSVDADPLFAPEGPTDTAALLDLGVSTIGRPSCTAGIRDVVQLASGRDLVVVADRDSAGQEGAKKAARAALTSAARVRVWTPPADDVRSWLTAGATEADLAEALSEATDVVLTVEVSS